MNDDRQPPRGLTHAMREWIDDRVRIEFERDRKFLHDFVSTALRFGGVVLSAIALLVAVLGVKTYSDVREALRSAASATVREELKANDPNSVFRKTTDDLLNRALVNSYLIQVERATLRRDFSDVRVQPADAERLLAITRSRNSSPDLFDGAVEILSTIPSFDAATHEAIAGSLAEIATSTGSMSWIATEPSKRVAVLRHLSALGSPRATRVLKSVLREGDASNDILVAALTAAEAVKTPELLVDLRRYGTHVERRVRHASVLAIAAQLPTDPLVTSYVAGCEKGIEGPMGDIYAIRAAREILLQNYLTSDVDPFEQQRVMIAARLLEATTRRGGHIFVSSYGPGYQLKYAIEDPATDTTIHFEPLPSAFLTWGRGREMMNVVFQRASARSLDDLSRFVAAFSAYDSNSMEPLLELRVRGSGTVLTDGGERVSLALAKAIRSSPYRKGVRLFWLDVRGEAQEVAVVRITGAENLRFELSPRVRFRYEPSEDDD